MWSKRIIIRDERARCEIFWQLQFQSLIIRYLIINNCHQIPKWSWPELGTQPRLAVVTTHTIISVMVHCYLGFNGLTCWFTRIVNIFENAYIIWVCKTLSKCNIFSDVLEFPVAQSFGEMQFPAKFVLLHQENMNGLTMACIREKTYQIW